MIRLYLIRHGETEFNLQGRIQGQSDSPLTLLGMRQAEAIAKRLSEDRFSAIYSSDLTRARQTAEVIAMTNSQAVITTPLLREAQFGIIQGMNRMEIEEKYPAEMHEWRQNPHTMRPPGAETYQQVVDRCGKFIDEVLQAHEDGSQVLVVCHGGSLRGLIVAACHLPIAFYRMQHFSNASLSILDVGENPMLRLMNDTFHLANVEITDVDADNAE